MILEDGGFRFVFTARDYEASLAFYRQGLNLPLHHDWDFGPNDRGTVLYAGLGLIEIFAPVEGQPYVQPQGVSMSIMIDNADAAYQDALDKGLKILEAPMSFDFGQRLFRLQDPDGITVSLYQVL